jgi:hypothetical protein
VRAGALRKLAEFVAKAQPELLAVCEIGSGDARSFATRFAMQWAYRGRQALFWRSSFDPQRVADLYLPARTPLRRTGFVRVDGTLEQVECTLAATQFARARDPRVAQMRFARTQLRNAKADALFFACGTDSALGFADLGFRECDADARANLRVFVRGFERTMTRCVLTDV